MSCHLKSWLAQCWRETWDQLIANFSIHRGSKAPGKGEALERGRSRVAGLLPGSEGGDVAGAGPRKAEGRSTLPSFQVRPT